MQRLLFEVRRARVELAELVQQIRAGQGALADTTRRASEFDATAETPDRDPPLDEPEP